MAKKARRNATTDPKKRGQAKGENADSAADDTLSQPQSPGDGEVKDRIIGMEKIHSSDLLDHPMNFRKHTSQQKAAFKGILDEVGKADALVVYQSEREGGKYVVIDGHMRKNDFSGEWACIVTDLTDEEADKFLQVHDPVSAMAHTDMEMLDRLREQVEFDDASVRVMLDGIDSWQPNAKKRLEGAEKNESQAGKKEKKDEGEAIPEMELQPYEHYDYILVLATTTFDWNWLCTRLGLEKVDGSTDPRYKKIGLGRAINASRLIQVLKEADEIIAANRDSQGESGKEEEATA